MSDNETKSSFLMEAIWYVVTFVVAIVVMSLIKKGWTSLKARISSNKGAEVKPV